MHRSDAHRRSPQQWWMRHLKFDRRQHIGIPGFAGSLQRRQSMYHQGVDVSAVVVNVGSHSVKVGHAGADAPTAILSSVVGVRRRREASSAAMDGDDRMPSRTSSVLAASGVPRDEYVDDLDAVEDCHGVDIRAATRDGLVHDWDATLALVRRGSYRCSSSSPPPQSSASAGGRQPAAAAAASAGGQLASSSSSSYSDREAPLAGRPICIAEPVLAPSADRRRWAEHLLEQEGAAALVSSREGVLECFSAGATSGLAINCGHSGVSVTPVQDGYPLLLGLRRSTNAGAAATDTLVRLLEGRMAARAGLTPEGVTSARAALTVGGASGFGAGMGAAPMEDDDGTHSSHGSATSGVLSCGSIGLLYAWPCASVGARLHAKTRARKRPGGAAAAAGAASSSSHSSHTLAQRLDLLGALDGAGGCNRSGYTASFLLWHARRAAEAARERVCRVAETGGRYAETQGRSSADGGGESGGTGSGGSGGGDGGQTGGGTMAPAIPYELPDGSILQVDAGDRYRACEVTMAPWEGLGAGLEPARWMAAAAKEGGEDRAGLPSSASSSSKASASSASASSAAAASGRSVKESAAMTLARRQLALHRFDYEGPSACSLAGASPLSRLVVDALVACEPDARRECGDNVVLTGGYSQTAGLQERLKSTLAEIAPAGARMRFVPAASPDPRFGAWVGGSIVASMGTFPDLWVSKAEWDEHGESILLRKCV